jgi:hypothetical protein
MGSDVTYGNEPAGDHTNENLELGIIYFLNRRITSATV